MILRSLLTVISMGAIFFHSNLLVAEESVSSNPQVEAMFIAAENGNPVAQFNVGTIYDQGSLGYEKDLSLAFDWYEKSAQQGFAPAQYNLGSLLLGSPGVKKDMSKATELLKLAADQGFDKAQADLGHLYRRGIGFEKNYVKALRFYELAAGQGHVESMFAAGHLRQSGGFGLDLNQQESAIWFQMGSLRGDSRSQTRLAAKLFKGEGVEKDATKAYVWLLLASAQKNKEAMADLKHVVKSLNADQLVRAKKLAATCEVSNFSNCPQAVVFG